RAALDLKGAKDPKASASRCAARAALDLKGAKDPKASAPQSAARAALDLTGAKKPKTYPSHKRTLPLQICQLCRANSHATIHGYISALQTSLGKSITKQGERE
ncbi:hypothetical protein ABEH27_25580, partial [Pseudomonas sp. P39-UII1]|uniref:hypothetical protein n=1 Tax=Pseudomonas sp. P39-UII1 TaxID=3080333 RepID=UPI003209FDB6